MQLGIGLGMDQINKGLMYRDERSEVRKYQIIDKEVYDMNDSE